MVKSLEPFFQYGASHRSHFVVPVLAFDVCTVVMLKALWVIIVANHLKWYLNMLVIATKNNYSGTKNDKSELRLTLSLLSKFPHNARVMQLSCAFNSGRALVTSVCWGIAFQYGPITSML